MCEVLGSILSGGLGVGKEGGEMGRREGDFFLKCISRLGRMAQWVRAVATKPDDLSLLPGSTRWEERIDS